MNKEAEHIASVVLAAGEGRRVGGNKALLEIGGVTFLAKVVTALKAIESDPIVVVGGANYHEVEKLATKLEIGFAYNDKWQSGQFSSLIAGLKYLKKKPPAVLIALVDHPLVKSETCSKLIKMSSQHPQAIIIPTHESRRGHPIIIPGNLIPEIIEADENSNLRVIINNHQKEILELPVDDSGILKDIDTKADFEDIKAK
jgi:molybdenum cofactor cytidylyltransferase